MKTIYVGFSKSKKKLPIGSWVIRFYQRTPFSHVYIRLPIVPRFPSDKILHASEGLVQNMSKTQFDKKHRIVKEFPIEITESRYRHLIDKMHELSGADYSYMQNVGIFIVSMLRYIGIKIRNPWRKDWNCSEYVAHVLWEDVPGFNQFDPNLVTPKDLYTILSNEKH